VFGFCWKLHCDDDWNERLTNTLCDCCRNNTGLRHSRQSVHCHCEQRSEWSFNNNSDIYSGIHGNRRPNQQCLSSYRSSLHPFANHRHPRPLRHFSTVLLRSGRNLHSIRDWNQWCIISFCNRHLCRPRLHNRGQSDECGGECQPGRDINNHDHCSQRLHRSCQPDQHDKSQRNDLHSQPDEHRRLRNLHPVVHCQHQRNLHSHRNRNKWNPIPFSNRQLQRSCT